jgi:hypothetical protein
LDIDAVIPNLVSVQGQGNLPFPDINAIPIVPPAFTPGPGIITINNPHPVPIVLDMLYRYHIQMQAADNDTIRFEGQISVNGGGGPLAHALASGPNGARIIVDTTDLILRQFVLLPALGNVTIQHSYRAFLGINPPVNPNTNIIDNNLNVSWHGVGLIP